MKPNEKFVIKPTEFDIEFVDFLYETRQIELDILAFLETDTVPKTPMKERAKRLFEESLDESVPTICLDVDESQAEASRPSLAVQNEKPSTESAKEVPTMESVEEEPEEEEETPEGPSSEQILFEQIDSSRVEYEKRYSSLKVIELKKICDKENLPKVGRKAEIVNRLVDNSEYSSMFSNAYFIFRAQNRVRFSTNATILSERNGSASEA